ncbi:PtdIns-3-kinase tor2 [Protomyces lactucae-debilis]|uniref:non-specific serine/threonine protein kinase n=1 Tax=Protomyces lactucae-debilis TaxID=2754530 RepID=A0A1Y2F9P3_PROLT|nr:PtdIns-3-kinase tor2 [Protomyces lactucae-debilis]ORY80056.1 PtdIns-3-kinase tor2 [Protomyces lactucae-debilis]
MEALFSDLRSRNTETRLRAANDLRDYVIATSRELSGEAFTRFNNEINKKIFELIHSHDNHEKLGAIVAIDRLIEFESEDGNTKITRFANYLRIVLPGNDQQAMTLAAKALGKLAVSGGVLTAEFVEFEIKRSLEWLQGDRNENRRMAAVLVIREFAINAPTLIYSYVSQILDLLWMALRDPKVVIRISAADALSSCLDIVFQREGALRTQWYIRILDEADHGFKSSSVEVIHGSLLAYRALLLKAGMFMHERYRATCDLVLRYKDHRDSLVRRMVVSLIPALASYNPSDFTSSYLTKSMSYLLAQLKKERDRTSSYVAIGEVAIAVKSAMNPYLDAILANVREGLATKGRARRENETAIFQCISMLAIAVGQALKPHMHELLDMMFACGLSETLRNALVDLAHHIPPLLPTIQERLLNLLSLILSGRPFRPPGAPTAMVTSHPSREARDALAIEGRDADLVSLALTTLGTFDFTNNVLNELVRDCVISYLEDDNSEVRKAAALTACQLFVRDPICFQTSNHAIQLVGEVLEKLLTVGIADPDSSIRLIVLSSLDERFDRHLAQAENVRSLFIALNDEVFEIRQITISIIGRLTYHNPAYVMPSLRKTLIQLLTELEFSGVSRNKEESARLLSLLIAAASKLIKPYVDPMLKVMLPRARDPSPGVASSVLAALGELSTVGGEDLLTYLDDLMPLIIETLQDQSSTVKRDAALRTLGQLASASGYVIDPYLDYPALLNILISFLKSEQAGSIRRETVKLIGILGALDPYRHQMLERGPEDHLPEQKALTQDASLLVTGMGPSAEEYYPTVVITTLMSILKDQSLSTHHTAVIQAIMYIFKTLGLKCVPFLSQIIPGFILVMRTSSPNILEFYFQQLGILISIVKQHIRNFLPDIFQLIRDFWNPTSNLQLTILALVESIARALEGEFKVFLPSLLPLMLQIFDADNSPQRITTQKVLHAFIVFGANVEEYMHLILPVIVRGLERTDVPISLRKSSIHAIAQLSRKVNFSDLSSRIIHPLARVLATGPHELKMAAMDCLCALVFQLGYDYAIFIPMVNKCLITNKIQHSNYDLLVSKLLKGESLPQDLNPDVSFGDLREGDATSAEMAAKKLPVNQQHLKNAWEASQRSTRDDWQEWIRRLSVELLNESPSHALRACAGLAGLYYPLARELFNAAFVSCWTELYEQYQDELVRAIETALTSPNIPPEILQALLNLAEFMEHDDKALPIDIRTLGSYAAKCHAFAKALHYKELEFISEPSAETIESLISINNQLQQPDAAIGILTNAQQHDDLELKETWYEKLQRWEDALHAYEKRSSEEQKTFAVTMGKMRCLHALGEWDYLSQLAQDKWIHAGHDVRRSIAPLAAAAAWGLGQWELMDDYIGVMKADAPDKAFFKAIISLHRNQFPEALLHITRARDLLDTELTALVGESYNRAYSVAVRVQMLAELEEIITYKQSKDLPARQAIMRKTWMKRLKGCQRNVEVWQRMLKVRALVISPGENMEMWIKFANLCRKSGRLGLAEKSLNSLLPEGAVAGDLTLAQPRVVYAHLKYQYETQDKALALSKLQEFTTRMSADLGMDERTIKQTSAVRQESLQTDVADYYKLLARCYNKQGEWQVALERDWTINNTEEVLQSYHLATQFDKDWYKAWHSWALANFDVIQQAEATDEGVTHDMYAKRIRPAVQAFFRSIALSSGNSLQDTLRLLSLWFKYANNHDVSQAITEGFTTVSIDTWLEVIPQLIARIHAAGANVRRLIHLLLADVGRAHPQALVYPLTVASKSQSASRQRAALDVMDKMKVHSAILVEQAELVSHELIRVAILWHEQWHEGLEEASRLYFGDRNIEAMFATLEPLHELLERGPETLRETSFNQAFGRDLQEARSWCAKYKRTQETADLNAAWDLYYQVFRKISRQLPQLTTLELQYVSPKLLEAQDLELAVPGTYHSGREIIKIGSFASTFNVITSKQRPRRLTMKGSDGKDYQYVLKGHEDIRQDERVMQLFGLVNTLLSIDSESFKRHLNIQRYPVIPLSPNSGLLGWVPDSDTLHVLIRDYRDSRKILLNIEHRLMLQMAPDYDNLTLLQKVEVFEYALDNTTGQDLYRVLWLKSRSSEAWLDRRTNYTRSLAVMSMTGYILGLGDRHPSNLMLDRYTGKVIHIDFGDCFEVAMHREKFPERIPFRLTRMLTNAMEVSGIEGSFRITCEHVMRVLRENKESLMAVLEAFVYDPLINWRLLTTGPSPGDGQGRRTSVGEADGEVDENLMAVRRTRPDESEQLREAQNKPEVLNQRAVNVLNRVSNKLTGRDFKPDNELDVKIQVEKLIQQATSLENLCQAYIGWCAFW